MSFSMRCLILGHDDMIMRAPARLSLRCDHCGRQTPGWSLGRDSCRTAELGFRAVDYGGHLDVSSAMSAFKVVNRNLLHWWKLPWTVPR
jgi:hypothetical protein